MSRWIHQGGKHARRETRRSDHRSQFSQRTRKALHRTRTQQNTGEGNASRATDVHAKGRLEQERPHAVHRARRPALQDSRRRAHPAMGGYEHQAAARQAPHPVTPDPRRPW